LKTGISPRGNAVRALTKYFLRHIYFRAEGWIMSSCVLCILAAYTINTLRSVTRDAFVISGNIYEQPIYAAVLFVCVFSSLLQTLHVSRDIDSRVYESYLYGPVDETAYMVSIFISYGLVNFLAILCFPLAWAALVYALSGIPLGFAAFVQLVFGFFLSTLILLIALCIGAAAKRSKLALWYLILFHAAGIGIVAGNRVISKYLIPLKRSDVDMFSFFRNISQYLFDSSLYFSPYTQFYVLQKNFYYSPGSVLIMWAALLGGHVFFALLGRYLFRRSIA
jgi:hypothetical protein